MRMRFLLTVLSLALAALPAAAQPTKLVLINNFSSLFMPAVVAKERGIFAAHGLEVTFSPTALNSTMPAALLSGSGQLAGTTTTVMLQAVSGGIKLVAVAGTALAYRGGTNEIVVARPGTGLARPADFVGHSVGVPGIGAIMDVFFRNWLLSNGTDPNRVRFVEVGLPQALDALRNASVDAEVMADPASHLAVKAGLGQEVGNIWDVLDAQTPIVVWSALASWARDHPDAVHRFQAANRESVAWCDENPGAAKEILVAYLKLPAAAAAQVDPPKLKADVTAAELDVMQRIMLKQGMLPAALDTSTLVAR